jgi:Tol biopolymer transport system component
MGAPPCSLGLDPVLGGSRRVLFLQSVWKQALVAAGYLVSACGSRTGLDITSSSASAEAGAGPDATDGAQPQDAELDTTPPSDATEEPEASSCGAPWVLFSLLQITEDGGGQLAQIYARRADGTDGHVLPLPVSQVAFPSVSPDGTELLFANYSLSALYLYRFGDGSYQELQTGGGVGYGAVSPDGRTVVFGDGKDLLKVSVEDGGEQTLVTESQPNAAGHPVFTRDSQTVVFGATSVVQSVRVDGSDTQTLLSESNESFPDPTLSPDYRELAAVVSCGGPLELRVYPFESLPASCDSGRVVTEVPSSPFYYAPSWGPDGLIAYAGNQDVFVVSSAGGTPRNLTADLTTPASPAGDPTWAPACTVLPVAP